MHFSNKIKQKVKTLLQLDIASGTATVLPDDVYITSYPKSGNTWVKFLVANLLYTEIQINFDNIELLISDIYKRTDKQLLKMKRPRILKSHESFNFRYKNVIYIVRDPRDVTVSFYYHQLRVGRITNNLSQDDYIKAFIDGEYGPSGSWGEHVGSWLGARQKDDNFLLIRYEDLKKQALEPLTQIARFLKITRRKKDLLNAIDNSSFEKMKRYERISTKWEEHDSTVVNIPFIRSGIVGDYRNQLSERNEGLIVKTWGHLMKHLEYL